MEVYNTWERREAKGTSVREREREREERVCRENNRPRARGKINRADGRESERAKSLTRALRKTAAGLQKAELAWKIRDARALTLARLMSFRDYRARAERKKERWIREAAADPSFPFTDSPGGL